ncbi:MAG: homoserine dehydrogenase [Planctomycetota bacterium]|jgi:homoserine dehydrogenase|nr:homoserine dehydrogenase [Planctomycetota bacterium]
MSERCSCGIGLIGGGVVGGGVVELLLRRKELLARRTGIELELLAVADIDRERVAALGVPENRIVSDYRRLFDNPEIRIVVELIGGVGVAAEAVLASLDAGRRVVTANKALLANRGREIFSRARGNGVGVAFEAAVAGGIPLIASIRDGLIVNRTQSLLGIVNGTCNYILSQMAASGRSFADCLAEAQRLGFAEADPSADIDGLDSGHKLALLSALAFETWVDFPALHIEGIRGIKDDDIRITRDLGYTLKLLAIARPEHPPETVGEDGKGGDEAGGRLFLSVHPALLRNGDPLAGVSGSLNAVRTVGDAVRESMFYGRGAGRYPTASAVVSDIAMTASSLIFGDGYRGWLPPERNAYEPAPMDDYRTRYYLRFAVRDRPGVLGNIATALGSHRVSIAAAHQFENDHPDGFASVCIFSHLAREGDIRASLAEIGGMDFLRDKPVLIRIED